MPRKTLRGGLGRVAGRPASMRPRPDAAENKLHSTANTALSQLQ